MTFVDLAGLTSTGSKRASNIAMRETNWGVAVSEKPVNKQALATTEALTRTAGLLMIMGGGAISLFSPTVLTGAGFALAFGFVGFSLHRYARNGFRSEIRIDTRFGGVRVGKTNAAGDFSETRKFVRSEVESFFIQRSQTGCAKLCLRLKHNSQRIILFQGTEDDLLPSFERITEALFVKKGSGKRVKTRANDHFIHATFV